MCTGRCARPPQQLVCSGAHIPWPSVSSRATPAAPVTVRGLSGQKVRCTGRLCRLSSRADRLSGAALRPPLWPTRSSGTAGWCALLGRSREASAHLVGRGPTPRPHACVLGDRACPALIRVLVVHRCVMLLTRIRSMLPQVSTTVPLAPVDELDCRRYTGRSPGARGFARHLERPSAAPARHRPDGGGGGGGAHGQRGEFPSSAGDERPQRAQAFTRPAHKCPGCVSGPIRLWLVHARLRARPTRRTCRSSRPFSRACG